MRDEVDGFCSPFCLQLLDVGGHRLLQVPGLRVGPSAELGKVKNQQLPLHRVESFNGSLWLASRADFAREFRAERS